MPYPYKPPPKSPLQLTIERLRKLDDDALRAEYTRVKSSLVSPSATMSMSIRRSTQETRAFQDAHVFEIEREMRRRDIVVPT